MKFPPCGGIPPWLGNTGLDHTQECAFFVMVWAHFKLYKSIMDDMGDGNIKYKLQARD